MTMGLSMFFFLFAFFFLITNRFGALFLFAAGFSVADVNAWHLLIYALAAFSGEMAVRIGGPRRTQAALFSTTVGATSGFLAHVAFLGGVLGLLLFAPFYAWPIYRHLRALVHQFIASWRVLGIRFVFFLFMFIWSLMGVTG